MVNSVKTFLKQVGKDYQNQSVNPPVVRASTIIFKTLQDIKKTQSNYKKNPLSKNFDYGRKGTSTTFALQELLRKIENAYQVYLTPTGFGAVFLGVISVVRPGECLSSFKHTISNLLINLHHKSKPINMSNITWLRNISKCN